MRKFSSVLRGFTLIELLIVVAIIAILAAIAVPNFLEAQTRAKVSRVKADLRSVATALESYAVDHNKYPPLSLYKQLNTAYQSNRGGINAATPLTTPVAYLTTVSIPDPFGTAGSFDVQGFVPDGAGANATDRSYYLHYVNVLQYYEEDIAPTNPSANDTARILNRPRYYIFSLGPDYLKGPNAINGGTWGVGLYGIIEDPFSSNNSFDMWQYDPTNGTRSAGDILRYQGQ